MRNDGSVPIHHRFPIKRTCEGCEYLFKNSIQKLYECDMGYFAVREEGDIIRPQRCIEDEQEERKSCI